MNITRHNCEAAFLDYYEKNLSPVEVAEVLFFLEENADLKEVFESYEVICLEQERISYPDKNAIKKKYSREEIEAILSSDITTTNCEQFFIADAEGILTAFQKKKLNLFLLQYPERKKEAELFLQCRLPAEKITFEGKESLKKELITQENREEYFIRSIENDLNVAEQRALSAFLSRHPEFKHELDLFSKTIVTAEVISFENKSSLKKRDRKPVLVPLFTRRNTYYAAAAAILLLAGVFFILRNNNGPAQQVLADKNSPAKNEAATPSDNMVAPERESNAPVINDQPVTNQAPTSNQSIKAPSEQRATNHMTPATHIKESLASNQPESPKQKINFQPILVDDNDHLMADKEKETPALMEPEVITVQKEELKDNKASTPANVMASAPAKNREDEYQTISSFAKKKIKATLGIQNANPCEAEDELSMWDLAMVAKQGVQRMIGTKAVDVNKACDGTGDKVEYVFTAGNFEISRSTSK
jgi:hypothetical protein